jgi:methylmalonyl-CoA mutase cobalamin-binding domain/chain
MEMTESDGLLEGLQTAVSKHDHEMLRATIDRGIEAGAEAADMHRSILLGLEKARHTFMSNDTPLPDFLLCIDAVSEGLGRLAPLRRAPGPMDEGIAVVIGVVEGDPHDMGKNIIAAVYRAYGYRVVDLGCQVPSERFAESVAEHGAEVLALSAMMSTTVVAMRDIIRDVKGRAPDTVVMVGGAPMDEALARSYGADGYAETAVSVLEETKLAIDRAAKESSVRP